MIRLPHESLTGASNEVRGEGKKGGDNYV